MDRAKVDPAIVKAAEGMETMFLEHMMRVMRQTVPKNDLDLENAATEIYRSMLDGETAKAAARGPGVGLADQIIAYLMADRYNQERRTGGTPHGTQQSRTPAQHAANAESGDESDSRSRGTRD